MLWMDLGGIAQNMIDPWLVAGDFNDVLKQSDRIGKKIHRKITGDFQRCVELCQLEDLKFSGYFYTWNNKQENEKRVWAKIDRALVNKKWEDKFEKTEAVFLPEGNFDHSTILIASYK